MLAAGAGGHLLARGPIDELLLRALINGPYGGASGAGGEARLQLGRRTPISPRVERLYKLSKSAVPVLSANSAQLARLRLDDDRFAEWRTALKTALDEVMMAPDVEHDDSARQRLAQEVGRELRANLQRLEKGVKKSPALSAMSTGTTELAFAAVGATTADVITGSPWAGLAGVAAAKTSESTVKYLRALKERRKDKLVLDLMVSFFPKA